MYKKVIQSIAAVFLGCMLLSLMSFACRQSSESSPELKAEIEAIEAEVDELDQAEQEIEDAEAKLDSLLNEIGQ